MSENTVDTGNWLCLYDMIDDYIVAYTLETEENRKQLMEIAKSGFKNGYIIIGVRDFDKKEQQCKTVLKALLRRITE